MKVEGLRAAWTAPGSNRDSSPAERCDSRYLSSPSVHLLVISDNPHHVKVDELCGFVGDGARSRNLLRARQMLSQLSYSHDFVCFFVISDGTYHVKVNKHHVPVGDGARSRSLPLAKRMLSQLSYSHMWSTG